MRAGFVCKSPLLVHRFQAASHYRQLFMTPSGQADYDFVISGVATTMTTVFSTTPTRVSGWETVLTD
jgi:hypothetical protein